MKARPILFSGAMVRALLDGSKTQTRRVVRIPSGSDAQWADPGIGGGGYLKAQMIADGTVHRIRCPYGDIGDVLWVRERFGYLGNIVSGGSDDAVVMWLYHADGHVAHKKMKHDLMLSLVPRQPDLPDPQTHWNEYDSALKKWWERQKSKPSIHMPRRASRITLEISDVRVERLQDISEADAIAEGILKSPEHHLLYRDYTGDKTYVENGYGLQRTIWVQAVPSYQSLWDTINGDGAWAANPWVWVVEFKVHKRHVDEILRERGAQ
jgi:hypothetical protein